MKTEYAEDDFLMISGIQHFTFCKRQWALVHIEQQWEENLRTVEGKIMHERVDDYELHEKRRGIIISRGVAVFSRTLGINGICDIVEFHKDDDGVGIFGCEGKYIPVPVEYKRGTVKNDLSDVLQLTAQAMCLGEMLAFEIEQGYLYYGETRRRERVIFTDELRSKVKDVTLQMHDMYEKRYTPKVKPSKSCNACSMKEFCMPRLYRTKSVKEYISGHIAEEI